MPEGPSVKKFQFLCSPYVGKMVSRVGGSTRQINPDDLKTLTLWDIQVHGKNLFLAFGTKEKLIPSHGSMSSDLSEQRLEMPGSSSFLHGQKENEVEVCTPECYQQEESASWLASDMDNNNNGQSWKWLRFHFGLYGSLRANEFARANKANKRGDWKDPIPRLVLHFDAGNFLVFYNCRIQQCSSPSTDPAIDILSQEFDRERALKVLAKDTPVCYMLLNQSYFSGIDQWLRLLVCEGESIILVMERVSKQSICHLYHSQTSGLLKIIGQLIWSTPNWRLQVAKLQTRVWMAKWV
ncbi:endonuclease 8-like 2 isoform X3 [Protobothrops mucrosquamatus]|uniref:endonuclease 8-like 2 isoform X3 n=1 Tax=Protobothrops mucrosquamatus TaxID=103944 RepID=UPI0007757DCF|nr:endonuclease 8-like 2 isoform X3 [Protobothrops mucrosquamatus]